MYAILEIPQLCAYWQEVNIYHRLSKIRRTCSFLRSCLLPMRWFAILFSYWIGEYVKKGQFFCVQLIEETIPKSQNAILSVWPDDVSWQVTESNPQILHSIQSARSFYEISRWFLFCFQIVSCFCIPNFTLSATQWIEKTNAIGAISKAGLYGGTYARNESKEPSRWSKL